MADVIILKLNFLVINMEVKFRGMFEGWRSASIGMHLNLSFNLFAFITLRVDNFISLSVNVEEFCNFN